ncbi:MAG: toll/interleukin-1 receptor domain-containing protein [Oscillospiraceae bacterium]|nr:toll/interleukin-1 receptor domain-containing protein [Oscillospiraceae bacterium]
MYQENIDLFSPYKGNQPYIFISYSHRNGGEVLNIISKLQQLEFRIWYDSGINPGSEWDENIASHISGCAYFIAFISDEYLASSNCKDELNFARDKDKPLLLVYLKDTKLPEGMSMRLNRLQAIHKYTYARELDFYQKIIEADGINVCRVFSNGRHTEMSGSNHSTPQTVPASTEIDHAPLRETVGKRKSMASLICGILSLATLIFAIDGYTGLDLIGILSSIAAIILSSSAKKKNGIVNKKSKAGKTIGIIFISFEGFAFVVALIVEIVKSSIF